MKADGFADVNGMQLCYEVAGSGHPLVLVHGLSLKKRIPDACKVVLPGLGHMPNMEDPATFNKVVLDFLAAMDKTPR